MEFSQRSLRIEIATYCTVKYQDYRELIITES
jgi:hypothetical protein